MAENTKTDDDLKDFLMKIAEAYHFEGATGDTWDDNEDVLMDALRYIKRYAQDFHREKVRRKKAHYEANSRGLSGQDRLLFMDKVEPRIIAAAIRKRGVVFTGVRHGHIIRDMVMVGFLMEMGSERDRVYDKEQGFIDQYGKYYQRDEARVVALQAGQIRPGHPTLYSEDLW